MQAFYLKPWGDFLFIFAAYWPKETPGLFVALWKMEGLVGAHSGSYWALQVAITVIILTSLLFQLIKLDMLTNSIISSNVTHYKENLHLFLF